MKIFIISILITVFINEQNILDWFKLKYHIYQVRSSTKKKGQGIYAPDKIGNW